MSSSVNKVILVGSLGKDPETKTSANGNKIVTMSVATSEAWKDKSSGEKQEKTEWHNVVIYNQGLCNFAGYAKKGTKVYVEGSLATRKWTGADGVEKRTTEVVIGNFKGDFAILDDKKGDTTKAKVTTKEEIQDDKDLPF